MAPQEVGARFVQRHDHLSLRERHARERPEGRVVDVPVHAKRGILRHDRAVHGGVAGITGIALERAADLHGPRQHVAARELELGLVGRGRLALVAEAQEVRVFHFARVRHLLADGGAAKHVHALEAALEGQVVAGEDTRVGRRVLIEVVDQPQFGGAQIVDGDDVAIVERARHLERRVVRRADRQVVGPDEILVVATERAEGDRGAREHLALHAQVRLDLIGPGNAFGRPPGGLHAEVAVLTRSEFAPLGDVVAVGVRPRAGVGVVEIRVVGFGKAGRVGAHVLARTELHGRLAVAHDVPRHAETRRHVLPARHVLHLRERAEGHEVAGRHLAGGSGAVEQFKTQAGVDGEALERPRILDEEGRVGVHVGARILRRIVDEHRVRHAVAVALHQIGRFAALTPEVAVLELDARLHGMRAGDVGQRGHAEAANRFAVVDAAVVGAVERVQQDVALGNRVDGFGLGLEAVALVVDGKAHLPEQPGAERRRPLGLGRVVLLGRADVGGFAGNDHADAGRVLVAAELADPVEVAGDLVLAELRGQTHDAAAEAGVIHGLFARRGRAWEVRSFGAPAEEAVGDVLVDAPVAIRRKEPQPVLLDRTAERQVQVPHLVERVGGRQAFRTRVLGVVALEAAVGARKECRALEGVAAVLGNHVGPHAPGGHLSADRARLVADFLEHGVVEVTLHAAVALEAVEGHAVDLEGGVAAVGTVNREVAVLHARSAAHVRQRQPGARHQRAQRGHAAAGRHGIEHGAAQHHLLHGALHVDRGCAAGDRDALLERTDFEFGVDLGGEVGRQLQPVAHDGVEAGQRERDGIDAGAQVDDLIAPIGVGDGRAHLFDEGGAGHFGGDARHDAARGIANRSGDCALRPRSERRGHDTRQRHQRRDPPLPTIHVLPL